MQERPRRLVRLSEHQVASPACFATLRRLNPRLELVCLTPGVWWIGEVRRTGATMAAGRQRRGQLMKARMNGQPVRAVSYWKAELQSQGFRLLAVVTSPQPTPSQCYAAVAEVLGASRRQVEQALDRGIRQATGEDRREATTKWLRDDYARHQGRDSYRHAFHKPIYSIPGATA
jgi:hypothetical protein